MAYYPLPSPSTVDNVDSESLVLVPGQVMVTVAGQGPPLDEEHGDDNIGGHGNGHNLVAQQPPHGAAVAPPNHDARVLAAQFPPDGPRGTPAAAAWNAHAEKVLSVYRRTFHTEPGRPNFIRDPSKTVVPHNVKAMFIRGLFMEMFRDMGIPDTVMPTHWWAQLG
ncbi:hypothetical protein HDU88_002952 [Geranomyces variabilis]|nr:hypothetical protein HDU88_002952 [Geranomyces variabilis]